MVAAHGLTIPVETSSSESRWDLSDYHAPMGLNVARTLGSAGIGLATALVAVAAGVLIFLNPFWVGFEQVRTGADLFSGYSIDDVHRVTNAVLGELVFGPATFLQQVGGVPVFDPRERQHLADVGGVLRAFYAVAIAAAAGLAIAGWRTRDRRRLWQAVAAGAAILGGAVVIVGALFAVFFDTMFDIFHRVFFASGSYTFDPRQERLVQLFPEDFWSETSIALAVVVLAIAALVTWLALRRIAAADARAAVAPQAAEAPSGLRREGVA